MPELIRNLWQLKTAVFLHWCLLRAVPLDSWSNFGDVLSFHFSQEQMSENVVEEFRVVVTGSLAVRAPVDLEDLRGHGSLLRIIPGIRRKHFFFAILPLPVLVSGFEPSVVGLRVQCFYPRCYRGTTQGKGKMIPGETIVKFCHERAALVKVFLIYCIDNLVYWTNSTWHKPFTKTRCKDLTILLHLCLRKLKSTEFFYLTKRSSLPGQHQVGGVHCSRLRTVANAAGRWQLRGSLKNGPGSRNKIVLFLAHDQGKQAGVFFFFCLPLHLCQKSCSLPDWRNLQVLPLQ